MNRKIFITVSEGMIARNILRSFVLQNLLEDPGVEVGLLVSSVKAPHYLREFGSPRVKIFVIDRARSFFNRLLDYLTRNGYYSLTILTDQGRQFLIDRKYFRFVCKRLLMYLLGSLRPFHYLLRWLARFRAFSSATKTLFLNEKPDLLFATDVYSDLDLEVISAARALRLKTVGMVRSWDNLGAGGLMQIVPDLLLVWSPYLYQYAAEFQYVPKPIMKLVGIPQFDWYAKKDILLDRQTFLQRFGIAAEKKVILYAGIGSLPAPHEPEVMDIISKALAAGGIKDDPAVIFRPHPAFAVDRQKIADLGNIIFDDNVARYTDAKRNSWEMDKEAIIHFVNSLYHADVIIATASSIILDAVSFDKPIVGIAFDGYSEEPKETSLSNVYRNHTHARDLSRLGGFKIVYDSQELIHSINEYLGNPQKDAEGREKIRQEFIWKLDGQSAGRVAGALLETSELTDLDIR